MSEEKNIPAGVDLEAGVITLKKGENIESFKLNDADDMGKLVKLGQRGIYFDDVASVELGQMRTVISDWDSAIDAARKDDGAMEKLKTKMEVLIGRPFTKKEEIQIDKGQKPNILLDDDENSRLNNTIESLETKIESLNQSQEKLKTGSEETENRRLMAEISKEADVLELKFNGKDKQGKDNGSPKFERNKVFEFASESGITDLEKAFQVMNIDKLTAHSKKVLLEELKAQQNNRNEGFVEKGTQTAELKPAKPAKNKTYHQLGQSILETAKAEGLSLFKED